jgi:hypothetical protein
LTFPTACTEEEKEGKARWYMPIIPALGKLGKDSKFEASLGYAARSCLKI